VWKNQCCFRCGEGILKAKKKDGLIRDEMSIAIAGKLGIDFSSIEAQPQAGSRLAWVARAWNVDRELRGVTQNGPATVVSLGCGLDTAYFRLGNAGVRWYDIDLPAVVSLRNRLIDRVPGCEVIAGSIIDPETYASVQVRGKLVILAVGVLYYFTEEQVRVVFDNIAHLHTDAHMIMDYCSSRGVEMANQTVVHNCSGARMIWAVENGAMARMADQMHIMSFARLKLRGA